MTCNIAILGGGIGLSVTRFAVNVKHAEIRTWTLCLLFVTITVTKLKAALHDT